MKWVLAICCILATVSSGHGASIGIYATPGLGECSGSVSQGGVLRVYICVDGSLPGEPNAVYSSGEFRLTGIPQGWNWMWEWLHQLYNISGTLADGLRFDFIEPQSGVTCIIPLWLLATSQVENAVLRIERPLTPTPPLGQPTDCPWLYYPCGAGCEVPAICVEGGVFVINGSGGCTVATVEQTWTSVRQLYK